jgi:type III secretory pathway lipoprotein EscJ
MLQRMSAARDRLIVLVLVMFAAGCGGRKTIASAQDERSANRIMTLLATRAGIKVEKVLREKSNPPAFDLAVRENDQIEALRILERENLPAERKPDTCSLLDDTSLIPSAENERARRICGVAGDISNKLRRIEGVIEASTLVSMPGDDPLLDPTLPRARPRVSIMLTHRTATSPLSVEDVQHFAASALPELTSKDVFVRLIAAPDEYAATAPANTCIKANVLGLLICAEHRGRLANAVLAGMIISGLLAGLTVLATLRALRYRKDLTKLTAQVAKS